jgi:hypothetical protein
MRIEPFAPGTARHPDRYCKVPLQTWVVDRRHDLDAALEVARHPVGTADGEFFGATVGEVGDAAVLEEAAEDADDAAVRSTARTSHCRSWSHRELDTG